MKSRELENVLAETRLKPDLKNATAKKMILNFWTHQKRNLWIKDDFVFALGLPNGLRYLRWGIGAIRFGCRKNSTAGKMLGMPQNPQRQVHALLGGFVQDVLIDNQNQHHKTDKIIARTLFFSKNQKHDL